MSTINPLVRCLFLLVIACVTMHGQQWVNLFDGKTLNGWITREGNATVVVEDGAIVGTPVLPAVVPAGVIGPGSTFLCAAKEYGDFILEFDVKKDLGVNSGLQFRSEVSRPNTPVKVTWQGKEAERQLPPDVVYGYQFEIVDAANGRTGNVFDESRRMRLLDDYTTTRPEALKAFKDDDWNQCRLECRGDRIRTWVNGIACADFRDSMTLSGVLCFQIHNVRANPKPVRFRNIRIQELR